ncbi:MAG: FtsW/RodA/SpoVE family cell cycle protein [Chloroflexi bacterium]|nr:FtsW/RodA/SpoVE family cell cycle protein [Chloroflexota bacterium]MCL5274231.1 FtsW/RodA/SpoVE family cell cycle protein [Chloroflexota bacterium]
MATIQPIRSDRSPRSSITHTSRKARDAKLPEMDWVLVFVVGALLVLGIVMAYSTTFYWSASASKDGSPFTQLLKQLGFAAIGIVLFIVLSRLDYGIWNRLSLPAILLTLLVLVAVLIWGESAFGAKRTLFGFQPSEPAKIVALMYGATWLASRRKQVTSISVGLIPFAVIIGIVVALIAIEPDFSTSAIILLAASAMFFLAGASLIQIVLVSGAAVGFAYLMVNVFQHASDRLTSFFTSFSNGQGPHYHILQSLLAFGEGGIFGKGIGAGYQKFGLLPTPHTDSVIAVVAEEMGLLGVAVVLGLFALLAYRSLRIAQKADTTFGAFWAIGIIVWIMMQTLLNLLAMTGLLPLPGVPVPFLSVGGSSLIAVLAACGILVSISRGTRILPSGEDSDNEGADELLGGKPDNSASTTIRRRDSGSRAARTDRSQKLEDHGRDASSIVGRDVKFTPRLRKGSGATRIRSAVRWRDGRYGTGSGYPRGR